MWQALYEELKDKGFVVIAVSFDTRAPDESRPYIEGANASHPSLLDPHFRRTVVLLSTHDADGAMGVVLNRPMGKSLGDLDPVFALGALSQVPLFEGGPVQTSRSFCAHGVRIPSRMVISSCSGSIPKKPGS